MTKPSEQLANLKAAFAEHDIPWPDLLEENVHLRLQRDALLSALKAVEQWSFNNRVTQHPVWAKVDDAIKLAEASPGHEQRNQNRQHDPRR